jgi:release factor glutamine methyltransferase
MNLGSILKRSILELKNAGIETAELDAKVLLENSISKDSVFLFSHNDVLITNAEYSRFRRFLRRRKKGEPIAYILGHKEFFGYDFFVNKNVLVPRPETEWLVERSIEYLVSSIGQKQTKKTIIDIGTGSGCIIISLVKEILNTQYLILNTNLSASDISPKALNIARKNAKKLKAKNIKFYLSDLFSNKRLPKKFDLIIANLPYVPLSTRIKNSEFRIQSKEGIYFEPQDAIFAKDNGSAIIKKLLIETKTRIREKGLILIELDSRNAIEISNFAKKNYPNAKTKLERDLAGLNRYLVIQN